MQSPIETTEDVAAGLADGKPCQVICVFPGEGFPLGSAGAAKIINIGKILKPAGIAVRLLHCGPSPFPVNTKRSGVYDGISFEYTTIVKRPAHILPRFLAYLYAVLTLTRRLAQARSLRPKVVVYVYVLQGPLILYVAALCRVLGLPVVQDFCEWWPGEPTCSAFTRWLYRRQIFKRPRGALVISSAIEARVRELAAAENPDLRIYRLPCVVDARRFADPERGVALQEDVPQFVWCGTVNAWVKDVLFLIRAFALVRSRSGPCRLKLIGACTDRFREKISAYAASVGLSTEDVVVTGCVDDAVLEESYRAACALLLPLWNDDRSITRLPNKLGEYLASGRPVVSCHIGDLTTLLRHGESAFLGAPGSEAEFAENMLAILRDPARASEIGQAGRRVCLSYLDNSAHARGLSEFFLDCLRPPSAMPALSQDCELRASVERRMP